MDACFINDAGRKLRKFHLKRGSGKHMDRVALQQIVLSRHYGGSEA